MNKVALFLVTILLSGCAMFGSQNAEKAELYLRLGISHIENGNLPFALRELLKAEEFDNKNPLVQNNLGLVYFLRERFDLAEKHFRNAVKILPSFTDAKNNLARTLIEKEQYAEAKVLLDEVLNDLTYASFDKAYVNLGLLWFNQKKFDQSIAAFQKALNLQTDNCIANSYLGRSYFEKKDYGAATDALDRAVGFCQNQLFDEPHYYSALAWYRSGNKAKAEARFVEIIKLYPDGKYREKAKSMLEILRKGF